MGGIRDHVPQSKYWGDVSLSPLSHRDRRPWVRPWFLQASRLILFTVIGAYHHHVTLVCTALYVNLLETASLRWTDNCLVVIDEVHHCLKEHPYSRLIQLCRHSQLDRAGRPRLLGLTASPAGRETRAATVQMLQQLLGNIGVDRLVTVERHVDELAVYQSTAALDIRLITYSSSERQLRCELRRYILRCCAQLCELADSDALRQLDAAGQLGPEHLEELASDPDVMEVIHFLGDAVETVEPKDAGDKVVVSFLSTHVRVLCQAVETLDSLGQDSAYNELALLLRPDYVASFSHARDAGLPCDALHSLVAGYLEAEDKPPPASMPDDDGVAESTKRSATYVQLVSELETWWDCGGGRAGMALVLVRKRSMASLLSSLLASCEPLQRRQMRVVHIVGHGGGADCGMSVPQQARTLRDIQRGAYNVIVATSVAEEGVDLPACDLVVQLDAPDCVRALVQVRGRARKTGSRFVAFCRDAAQKSQLNSLLLHERHMTEAVRQIIHAESAAMMSVSTLSPEFM